MWGHDENDEEFEESQDALDHFDRRYSSTWVRKVPGRAKARFAAVGFGQYQDKRFNHKQVQSIQLLSDDVN